MQVPIGVTLLSIQFVVNIMNFEIVLIIMVVVIIGVNVATTVSTRFRRWLYSKESK